MEPNQKRLKFNENVDKVAEPEEMQDNLGWDSDTTFPMMGSPQPLSDGSEQGYAISDPRQMGSPLFGDGEEDLVSSTVDEVATNCHLDAPANNEDDDVQVISGPQQQSNNEADASSHPVSPQKINSKVDDSVVEVAEMVVAPQLLDAPVPIQRLPNIATLFGPTNPIENRIDAMTSSGDDSPFRQINRQAPLISARGSPQAQQASRGKKRANSTTQRAQPRASAQNVPILTPRALTPMPTGALLEALIAPPRSLQDPLQSYAVAMGYIPQLEQLPTLQQGNMNMIGPSQLMPLYNMPIPTFAGLQAFGRGVGIGRGTPPIPPNAIFPQMNMVDFENFVRMCSAMNNLNQRPAPQ